MLKASVETRRTDRFSAKRKMPSTHRGVARRSSFSTPPSQFNSRSTVLNYEYKKDVPCLVPIARGDHHD
jgi:hypothetical protein